MSDTNRAAFEANFKLNGLDFGMYNDAWNQPKYKYSHVQALFDGWQAALARPVERGAISDFLESWSEKFRKEARAILSAQADGIVKQSLTIPDAQADISSDPRYVLATDAQDALRKCMVHGTAVMRQPPLTQPLIAEATRDDVAGDANVSQIKMIGACLSHVAFNYAQQSGYTLTSEDCALLDKLRKQWDAAIAASKENKS